MAKKRTPQKRQWGATGTDFHLEAPMLNSDTRKHIEAILKEHGVNAADMNAFYGALSSAIGFFISCERIRQKTTRPKKVRENLRRTVSAARDLISAFQELDETSRVLLAEVAVGRANVETVVQIHNYLSRALMLAEEQSSRGGLPAPHRYFLADDVKDAIKTHLGVTPTSTKDGPFVAIMEIVIKLATGKEVKSVQGLVEQAIRCEMKIKNPDGTIKYVPPQNPI